ncbi:MAG TPA: hypothetical protein DCP37_06975 [Dehalococcoidia bacterium]|nr:hypothetical protein [Dehalococcoidia bacterium]
MLEEFDGMNVKTWIWCLRCEQCFSVLLTTEPEMEDADENQGMGASVFDHAYELEVQLGVETDGEVFATCPYEGCSGSLFDFRWWEDFRLGQNITEEVPAMDTVYPLYPDGPPQQSDD